MLSKAHLRGNSGVRSSIRLFLMTVIAWLPVLDHAFGQANPFSVFSGGIWIPATDIARVKTSGTWPRSKSGFRFAVEEHLMTKEDYALLHYVARDRPYVNKKCSSRNSEFFYAEGWEYYKS